MSNHISQRQQTMQGPPVGHTVLVTVLNRPDELLQQKRQRFAGCAAERRAGHRKSGIPCLLLVPALHK